MREVADEAQQHRAPLLGGKVVHRRPQRVVARGVRDGVARIGVRLAVRSASLARMVLALHDGLAIASVPDVEGPDAAVELERAALLLLLRSATTSSSA